MSAAEPTPDLRFFAFFPAQKILLLSLKEELALARTLNMYALAVVSTVLLAVAIIVAVSAFAQARSVARINSSTILAHNNGTAELTGAGDWSTGAGLYASNLLRDIGADGVSSVRVSNNEARGWAIALVVIAFVLLVYCHFFGYAR